MSLTVITGPMWSWKTSELIRRAQRRKFAKKQTLCFKPAIDTRYHDTQIMAHDGSSVEAKAVESFWHVAANVIDFAHDDAGLAIDEIQFLADVLDHLPLLAKYAADREVIVSGLDMDFKGDPFPSTAAVMAIADQVIKLTSICAKCGADAIHTQRVNDGKEVTSGDTVQVGGVDIYEPRCRDCFVRS